MSNVLFFIQNGIFTLKNIVFNASPGDLICIIGPVGSGKVCYVSYLFASNSFVKSSLLQTLTGEIGYFDGNIQLCGSFCYVPQEACE